MTGPGPGNACSPAAGRRELTSHGAAREGSRRGCCQPAAPHLPTAAGAIGSLQPRPWQLACPSQASLKALSSRFSAKLWRRVGWLVRSWGEGFLCLSLQPLLRIAATIRSNKLSAVSANPPDLSYVVAPVILLCISLHTSVFLFITCCFLLWCYGSRWEGEITALLLSISTDSKLPSGLTDLELAD